MSDWRYTITLDGFGEAEPSDFRRMAKVAHDAIETLMSSEGWDSELEDELKDIQLDFKDISTTPLLTILEFDNTLERLYDWGDTWCGPATKRAWIETSNAARKK